MPKATLPQLNAAYLKDFVNKLLRRTPPSVNTAIAFSAQNSYQETGGPGQDSSDVCAPIDASYVLAGGLDARLSNERVLTGSTSVFVTDGGPNAPVTLTAQWSDDGTNTLVPTTGNDNVEVSTNQAAICIYCVNTNAGAGAHALAGEADGGLGVVGQSNHNDGVYGHAGAAADRTNEQYSVNSADRTQLGDFADLNEVAAPQDAPANKVRIFAKVDGHPYSVDDAGNEFDLTSSGTCEWTDDGTGTLKPTTANDNVYVDSTTDPAIFARQGASGLGGNVCALRAMGNGAAGIEATSNTGKAIIAISNVDAISGNTLAAADRTNEQYCLYADSRTYLGALADLSEAAVPEDAPTGKVRIFAKTDGKPYSVDDAGNEYDLTSGGASFTTGMIMLWSGTIATIPAGWVLCDGANSTPDLRNRFIVCADADVGGVAKTTVEGAASVSGGSIDYTPAGTNSGTAINAHAVHNHPIDHTHGGGLLKQGTLPGAPPANAYVGNSGNNAATQTHTVGTEPSFAGTAAHIIPPYYALAYIMKT
jgi:hypothetical protein